METRLKQHLHSLNKCVFKHNYPESKELVGAYNKIYKGKLLGVNCEKLDEKNHPVSISPLMIFSMMSVPAIEDPMKSEMNSILMQKRIKDYKKGLELLRKNKIQSPFLHHFFYCSSDGKKVSHFAEEGDLIFLLQKKKAYSKEEIRSWVAQLLLGLNVLHEKNIVHRDIKTENIFVFKDLNNNIHLKIGDFDFLALCNQRDGYKGTLGFFPPEVFATTEQYLAQFNDDASSPNQILYELANKKAIDCFALGRVLAIINEDTKVNDPVLTILSNSLSSPDVKTRLTIAQALEDPYFGLTKEARKNYLDSIIQKFSQNQLYLDHYLPPHYPALNSQFYLLPEKIKKLFMLTEKLHNQYSFNYSEVFQSDAMSMVAMQNTVINLCNEINDALKDNELKEFHTIIEKLSVDVKQIAMGEVGVKSSLCQAPPDKVKI